MFIRLDLVADARAIQMFSAFLTADSAPSNPIRLWVPSQNGLFTDPPHRHRENAGLPVKSYLLPSASTSSIEPSGSSTRYGPFFLTVIFTAAMKPPRIAFASVECNCRKIAAFGGSFHGEAISSQLSAVSQPFSIKCGKLIADS